MVSGVRACGVKSGSKYRRAMVAASMRWTNARSAVKSVRV